MAIRILTYSFNRRSFFDLTEYVLGPRKVPLVPPPFRHQPRQGCLDGGGLGGDVIAVEAEASL